MVDSISYLILNLRIGTLHYIAFAFVLLLIVFYHRPSFTRIDTKMDHTSCTPLACLKNSNGFSRVGSPVISWLIAIISLFRKRGSSPGPDW